MFSILSADVHLSLFCVVTSSGESYEIKHPEMAWLIRYDIYVGLGGSGVPERAAFVSLLLSSRNTST